MSMDYFNLWGFLGTAGGAMLIAQFFTRNKTQAEANSLFAQTYGEVLGNMRLEVSRLAHKVQELEKRETRFLVRINLLETELETIKKKGKIWK